MDARLADGGLVGREAELERIEALLAGALAGESGVLALRGEPGIGKTALLLEAHARAGEAFAALRATGVEGESDIPYAALYTLLTPVAELIDSLPELQRAALGGALALGPPAAGDQLTIATAVLGLLDAAAEQRPLLVVVDDAQWLDSASAAALLFAARRLGAERIALLLGIRDGEGSELDMAGLTELTLAGLRREAATELLARGAAGREPADAVVDELLGATAGNPLALLELDGDTLRFRHPLVRAAVYHGSEPAQRRRAHAALAETEPSPARRAWHLADAAVGPDEGVAAALEAAAVDALSRGGHGAAAAAAERGAALTPAGPGRASRLVGAAELRLLAGSAERAVALAGDALELDPPPATRVRAGQVLSRLELLRGSLDAAHQRGVEAAELIERSDPDTAVDMYLEAGLPGFMSGRIETALHTCGRAYALAQGRDEPVQTRAAVLYGAALTIAGRFDEGRPLLERWLELHVPERMLASPPELIGATQSVTWIEEYDGCLAACDRVVELARSVGAAGPLQLALGQRAEVHYRLGDWTQCRADASESIRLAHATGQPVQGSYPLTVLAQGFGMLDPSVVQWRGDFIEALVKSSQEEEAREQIAVFADQARATGRRGRMRPSRAAAACSRPTTSSTGRSRTRSPGTPAARTRSSGRGPSCAGASACAARAGRATRAPTCARRSRPSIASVPSPGAAVPAPSCAPAVEGRRRPGRPSRAGSPRRSSRSPSSSPAARPTARRRRRCSSAPRPSRPTSAGSTASWRSAPAPSWRRRWRRAARIPQPRPACGSGS